MLVRVIDYTIDDGRRRTPTSYRLFTTLLDPDEAAAADLAAAYTQRWEIELTFDELKTHQRGPRTVLRSKSPDLVLQEIWGHLCCHYAIRSPDGRGRRPTPGTTPTGSASSPRCGSPARPSPTRAPFPPDQHGRDSPGWLAFLRRLLAPPQPRPTPPLRPPRHQTQDAQVARQTRPPRRLAPAPAPARPTPSSPLTERY